MATKIFDVAKMVSEDVLAYDRSAKFCTGNDDAPVYAQCDDGAFVTLGKMCADATYDGMVLVALKPLLPLVSSLLLPQTRLRLLRTLPSRTVRSILLFVRPSL